MLKRHPDTLHEWTETTPEECDVLRVGMGFRRFLSRSGAFEMVRPPRVLPVRHDARAQWIGDGGGNRATVALRSRAARATLTMTSEFELRQYIIYGSKDCPRRPPSPFPGMLEGVQASYTLMHHDLVDQYIPPQDPTKRAKTDSRGAGQKPGPQSERGPSGMTGPASALKLIIKRQEEA